MKSAPRIGVAGGPRLFFHVKGGAARKIKNASWATLVDQGAIFYGPLHGKKAKRMALQKKGAEHEVYLIDKPFFVCPPPAGGAGTYHR